MKVRKVSITAKILIIVLILLIFSDIFIGTSIYLRTKNALITQINENAMNITKCVAASVSGELLPGISAGDEEGSEAYDTVHEQLSLFLENAGVEYVYIVRNRADGSSEFVVDSDPEEPGLPGDDFEGDEYEMSEAYKGVTVVTAEPYTDEWGTHISAYSPIYADGKIVALAVTDISMDWINAQTGKILVLIIAVCLLALIVGVLGVLGICFVLRKGFVTLNSKISELADGNGDLTKKVDLNGGDEFETIGGNVNKFMLYIRDILLTVKNNSDSMKSTSEQMSQSVDVTLEAMDDVNTTMDEMSTTMKEVSASLDDIDVLIQSSTDSFDVIVKKIGDGTDFSKGMYDDASVTGEKAVRMEKEVTEKVNNMATVVEERIKDSQAVEKINVLTENIINITEQTTLLSLNASIEAARAGESGRGFAVVASEIGKLAQDSADAAAEIQVVSADVISAVDGLAKEAQKMVEFMTETAVGGYQSLVDTSNDYCENAERIKSMMDDFSELSRSIQENLSNVSGLTDSLNRSVSETAEGVSLASDKVTAVSRSMRDISEDTHAWSEISDELYSNVNKFKLE